MKKKDARLSTSANNLCVFYANFTMGFKKIMITADFHVVVFLSYLWAFNQTIFTPQFRKDAVRTFLRLLISL